MSKSGVSEKALNFIKLATFQEIVFCDAGLVFSDKFYPEKGKIVAWSTLDSSFVVQDVDFCKDSESFSLGKQFGALIVELMAIQMASQKYPNFKIYSDSKVAVIFAARILGIRCEWISRELNGVANLLATSSTQEGSGHVIFNESTPRRGWIHFEFEK